MRQQLVQSKSSNLSHALVTASNFRHDKGQVPTTRSNTTQDQTPEIDTEETPTTQDYGASHLQQQSVNIPASQEQYVPNSQAGSGVDFSSDPTMQPFIDFMMQDTDLMALGFFDESWLGVQTGEGNFGVDAPMPMSVGFEQGTVL